MKVRTGGSLNPVYVRMYIHFKQFKVIISIIFKSDIFDKLTFSTVSTACSQNLREYGCSNQTSETHGTLDENGCSVRLKR